MWHNGLPKPFLGHFITEVSHAKEPRMYPVRFYVFEDATNPPNLLSYATSERLGIVQFQVPNLAATHPLDQVAVPNPSGKRKTAKQVTFQDPICKIEGSHTSSNPPRWQLWQEEDHCSLQGQRGIHFQPFQDHQCWKCSKIQSLQDHQHYKGSQGRQRQFYTFQDHSSPKAPNSPASKTIRCSTPAIPPSQHYQVHSLPPRGAVTPGNFPT